MPGKILFLSKADGDSLLAAPDCYETLVPCLAEAMRAISRGQTSRQNRTSVSAKAPDGGQRSLMAGPAVAADLGAGIRLYTGVKGGPRPKAEPSGARVLFDYETMTVQMLAVEGNLHAARTAGGGAVVARALAPKRARLALIGSGRIASQAARAVLATCDVREVAVFSPTREHREELASGLQGAPARAASSMAEALAGAELVVSCTEAEPPALDFSGVERGAVVVSLGLGELTAETVHGGQLLCTGLQESLEDERGVEPMKTLYLSSPPAQEARDFFEVLAQGTDNWDRTKTTWVAALGTAVWDLALMRWLYERAVKAGTGTWLEA
jgi:alanine dehydrogenase